MRPIAFSRKNALSADSDEGAESWALLASLIEIWKLHDVNPQAYLTELLTKLVNNWANSRIADFTPWLGLPRTDRRGQPKPLLKPFRSWTRLITRVRRFTERILRQPRHREADANRSIGFGHLLFFGQGRFLDHADTAANITLMAREVLPRLRELDPKAKEPATAAAE